MSVCDRCKQLFQQSGKLESGYGATQDKSEFLTKDSIIFQTFSAPLLGVTEEDGIVTIKKDPDNNSKILCVSHKTPEIECVDLTKYEAIAHGDSCTVELINTSEEDMGPIFISFHDRDCFRKCWEVVAPSRPHASSTVLHDRCKPSTTPHLPDEVRTLGKSFEKGVLKREVQMKEFAGELKVTSLSNWLSSGSKSCGGRSICSESNMSVFLGSDKVESNNAATLKLPEDFALLNKEGFNAQSKRSKREVCLTQDQFRSLQPKKQQQGGGKFIITRGATFNNFVIREGDEIVKIDGIHTEKLELEDITQIQLTICYRPCPQAQSFSDIENTRDGLGIIWDGNRIVEVTHGPFAEEPHKDLLTNRNIKFCLTHCNGTFIPSQSVSNKKMEQIFQKADDKLSLIFQPEDRMKIVAGCLLQDTLS